MSGESHGKEANESNGNRKRTATRANSGDSLRIAQSCVEEWIVRKVRKSKQPRWRIPGPSLDRILFRPHLDPEEGGAFRTLSHREIEQRDTRVHGPSLHTLRSGTNMHRRREQIPPMRQTTLSDLSLPSDWF